MTEAATAWTSTFSAGDTSAATNTRVDAGSCITERLDTRLAHGREIVLADDIGRDRHEIGRRHALRRENGQHVGKAQVRLIFHIIRNQPFGRDADLTRNMQLLHALRNDNPVAVAGKRRCDPFRIELSEHLLTVSSSDCQNENSVNTGSIVPPQSFS